MGMANEIRKNPLRVGMYDIEKTIGKGNFAVVKLAHHRTTKSQVRFIILCMKLSLSLNVINTSSCTNPLSIFFFM